MHTDVQKDSMALENLVIEIEKPYKAEERGCVVLLSLQREKPRKDGWPIKNWVILDTKLIDVLGTWYV